MSDRIDSTAAVPLRPGADPQPRPELERIGNWQGESVQLGTALPTLRERARRHLAAAAQSEIQVQSRPLHERRFSKNPASGHHIHSGARARALLGRMPDFDPNRLVPLIEDLDDVEDPRKILQKCRKHFADPSLASIALELVEQQLRDGGQHDLAKQTREARDLLEEEEGPAARAGINASLAVYETSDGDRMAAAALRSLYRDAVFAKPGPLGLYRGIIAKGGVEDFTKQVRFLSRAVGDDLAAAGPSVEPARLHELVRDLSSLRVLDTVHERCVVMAARLERSSGLKLGPTEIIGQLLPLIESASADASQFVGLPAKLGMASHPLAGPIRLLNEAREVIALLPPQLFRDLEARFAVFQGLRQALDLLISREEAE